MDPAFDNDQFTFWWTLTIMGMAYSGFLYCTLADTVATWWRGKPEPPEPEPIILALPAVDTKRKAA